MILIHLIISENHNLQQGLNKITLPLLTRDYPLEMINENIRQAMNNSKDTILHISKSSKTYIVLSCVTCYSSEGQKFSQQIKSEWNIIQNEPLSSQIQPSNVVIACTKTWFFQIKQQRTSPSIWQRLIY